MEILIYSGNACAKNIASGNGDLRDKKFQEELEHIRPTYHPRHKKIVHMHADGNEEEQQGKFAEEPNREKISPISFHP